MPAYDYSNWFVIFFVIYVILNLYIFMNIVLAVVYNNYKKHLKVGISNLTIIQIYTESFMKWKRLRFQISNAINYLWSISPNAFGLIFIQNEVKATVYLKRKLLARAFEHIKVWKSGSYVMTRERWHQLMRLAAPKRSPPQIDLLLHVLDNNGDGCVGNGFIVKFTFSLPYIWVRLILHSSLLIM